MMNRSEVVRSNANSLNSSFYLKCLTSLAAAAIAAGGMMLALSASKAATVAGASVASKALLGAGATVAVGTSPLLPIVLGVLAVVVAIYIIAALMAPAPRAVVAGGPVVAPIVRAPWYYPTFWAPNRFGSFWWSRPIVPAGGGIVHRHPAGPVGGGVVHRHPAGPVGGGVVHRHPAGPVGGGVIHRHPAGPVGGGVVHHGHTATGGMFGGGGGGGGAVAHSGPHSTTHGHGRR